MSSAPLKPALPFVIAGVDEVGRGPLAGPVVAAAVVLDARRPIDGLDDSKRLIEAERERLDRLIRQRALAWCVASASVAEIDEINILHASMLAMQRAVEGLSASASGGRGGIDGCGADGLADPYEARPGGLNGQPNLILVDGNRAPALPYRSAAIVGGDARVASIAAASIIAKVSRDALMKRWHKQFPAYGFASHKGYATKTHRDALEQLGATPLHRCSFAPVRAALGRRGGVFVQPLGTAASPDPLRATAVLSSTES